jgi:hypothetical protein
MKYEIDTPLPAGEVAFADFASYNTKTRTLTLQGSTNIYEYTVELLTFLSRIRAAEDAPYRIEVQHAAHTEILFRSDKQVGAWNNVTIGSDALVVNAAGNGWDLQRGGGKF